MQPSHLTHPTDLSRLQLCAEAWIKRRALDPVLPAPRPGWPIDRGKGLKPHPQALAQGQGKATA